MRQNLVSLSFSPSFLLTLDGSNRFLISDGLEMRSPNEPNQED